MTRDVLAKITPRQREQIEDFRRRSKNIEDLDEGSKYWESKAIMKEASAYTKGLRDADAITERERQILFIYTTV